MERGKSYRQVNGVRRHTYVCPRGVVAIDECRDGSVEVTRCTMDLTEADVSDAIEMHRARFDEDEE